MPCLSFGNFRGAQKIQLIVPQKLDNKAQSVDINIKLRECKGPRQCKLTKHHYRFQKSQEIVGLDWQAAARSWHKTDKRSWAGTGANPTAIWGYDADDNVELTLGASETYVADGWAYIENAFRRRGRVCDRDISNDEADGLTYLSQVTLLKVAPVNQQVLEYEHCDMSGCSTRQIKSALECSAHEDCTSIRLDYGDKFEITAGVPVA